MGGTVEEKCMSSDEIIDDPFSRLIETFSVLENDNRAICLISVYIGQKTDSNTIKGILEIYNKLKGEIITPGKLRGYLTAFVNVGLIERETEKVIGTTKVSYHQITNLGVIGVLYLCFNLIDNPNELDWNIIQFKEQIGNDEKKFTRYLTDTFVLSLKSPAKVINLVTSGSNLTKLKIIPLDATLSISLSKDKTFKVFEELLFNFLQFQPGLSKNKIEDSLEGEKLNKYIKRLSDLMTEEKIGKISYYLISNKGLFLLPIIILFIRELSLDKTILEPLVSITIDDNIEPWFALTKRSILLFKKLFSIEEIY